jgi:hypothetical protein
MIPALREFFYFVDKVQFFAPRQHLPFGCATIRLERLVEEIENLQTTGLDDVDTLLKVQARCREAIRVIPDLAFYFREQERAKRFQEATTGTLDKDSSRLLANLIKEMMSSSKM